MNSLLGQTLHALGIIEQHKGNYDEAKRLYDESLEIRQRLGEQLGIAQTLHQLANIEYLKHNYDQARHLYCQSLDINKGIGNQSGVAATLGQLARVEFDLGNQDEAAKLYSDSLEIDRKLGHQSEMAIALRFLGLLAESRKDLESATRFPEEAVQIVYKLGEKSDIESCEKAEQLSRQALTELRSQMSVSQVDSGYALHWVIATLALGTVIGFVSAWLTYKRRRVILNVRGEVDAKTKLCAKCGKTLPIDAEYCGGELHSCLPKRV